MGPSSTTWPKSAPPNSVSTHFSSCPASWKLSGWILSLRAGMAIQLCQSGLRSHFGSLSVIGNALRLRRARLRE